MLFRSIRWRLHGEPRCLLGDVLPAIHAALEPRIRAGLCARLELATYERETERYGGAAAMELTEELFAADSDAAIALIDTLRDVPEGRTRWSYALYGMDRLIADFEIPLERRVALSEHSVKGFYKEQGIQRSGEHAIAARFRAERTFVDRKSVV